MYCAAKHQETEGETELAGNLADHILGVVDCSCGFRCRIHFQRLSTPSATLAFDQGYKMFSKIGRVDLL